MTVLSAVFLYSLYYMYLCTSFKKGTDMQRNTKDWIHYSSAGIVLIAGIVLVYISFFMSHDVTRLVVLWAESGLRGNRLWFRTDF